VVGSQPSSLLQEGLRGLIISPVTTFFLKIGYCWAVRTMAIVRVVILIPASALFKAGVEPGKDRAKRLK
ncbi:hypothetical protein KI688_007641, partial [Linnemannia hyalina]